MAETPVKLGKTSLDKLPAEFVLPSYNRDDVKTSIVHIGPGAFFRGHLATYCNELLNNGRMDAGICAVSLKSPAMRDKLAPQDNLFSLNTEKGTEIIGSIIKAMVAREDPKAVIAQMADPDIKLVSLTVTQKGYYYDADKGALDFNHPDIQECLDDTSDNYSTVGYIVAALDERMKNGIKPFTVMSCDNLPHNGDTLRNVVLAYASHKSPQLGEWIRENVAFPNTMVDRIVPATSQTEVDKFEADNGVSDNWPIYTEPFKQFVVENKASDTMPDLGSVGALMVDDVLPFELMKIRILNGSHMALGPIGYMSGYKLGNDALSNPEVKRFIEGFMGDVEATLPDIPGIDTSEYKEQIMERISGLPDDLTRLARNGSQKVPSRFLDPLRDAIAQDSNHDHILFALAGWMRYAQGLDKNGQDFDTMDEEGLRMGLQDTARQNKGHAAPLVAMREIFGHDLGKNKEIATKLEKYLYAIEEYGMEKALEQFNAGDLDAAKPAPSRTPSAKPAP